MTVTPEVKNNFVIENETSYILLHFMMLKILDKICT